jgi:hypothetical protein
MNFSKKKMHPKILLFLILLSSNSFSQIFHNSDTDNLRYAGALTKEVIALLYEDEKRLLNACIQECGINPDSAKWISPAVYEQLIDPDYYHTMVAYKSSSNQIGGINLYDGKNKLTKPELIVFIDRYNGEFEVIVQKYY